MMSTDRFIILPGARDTVRDISTKTNYHLGSKAEAISLSLLLNEFDEVIDTLDTELMNTEESLANYKQLAGESDA